MCQLSKTRCRSRKRAYLALCLRHLAKKKITKKRRMLGRPATYMNEGKKRGKSHWPWRGIGALCDITKGARFLDGWLNIEPGSILLRVGPLNWGGGAAASRTRPSVSHHPKRKRKRRGKKRWSQASASKPRWIREPLQSANQRALFKCCNAWPHTHTQCIYTHSHMHIYSTYVHDSKYIYM